MKSNVEELLTRPAHKECRCGCAQCRQARPSAVVRAHTHTSTITQRCLRSAHTQLAQLTYPPPPPPTSPPFQHSFRQLKIVNHPPPQTSALFSGPHGLSLRRNPPEPNVLVHYGPWHFFFAIFLEMVISSGRSEPTVVIKLLPSPWKKKERAHGSFQRSWASCNNLFCRLSKNDRATLKLMQRWALHDTTHACSHFTTICSHGVLLVSLTP